MISALNKFWRPIDVDYYWEKMDREMVQNAVSVSGMPQGVIDWIFEGDKRSSLQIKKTKTYK